MKFIIIAHLIIFHSYFMFSQEKIGLNQDYVKNSNEFINIKEPETENFIYTIFENIIIGKTFQICSENDSVYISVDSLEVDLSYIKFIKYENNFWANTNEIDKSNKNNFALRTYKGRLNLYTRSEFRKNYYFNKVYFSSNRLLSDYSSDIEKIDFYYYNQGFDQLKLVIFFMLQGLLL